MIDQYTFSTVFKDPSHRWDPPHLSTFLSTATDFFFSIFQSPFQLISEMGREREKNIPFPNLFPTIRQHEAPTIWIWTVAVKNKCWWSSDVYNGIQVLPHIKALYGHIIKERRYCLDWSASWCQVANGLLMHPDNSRPSLWQAGELVTALLRPVHDRLSV